MHIQHNYVLTTFPHMDTYRIILLIGMPIFILIPDEHWHNPRARIQIQWKSRQQTAQKKRDDMPVIKANFQIIIDKWQMW